MKLNEAIKVLKDAKYIGSDEYASDYDREMNEAIDTVVAELEKPLHCDCLNRREIWERYECVDCGKLHIDREL